MNSVALDTLEPKKQEVLDKVFRHLDQERMGYIRVPTGWGKTFLAKHLMKRYLDQGKVVLFLVSGNNPLLLQTFFRDAAHREPLFPGAELVTGDPKTKLPSTSKLQAKIAKGGGLAVFASLRKLTNKRPANEELKQFLTRACDLVVVDEIHNFIENNGNTFIDEIADGNARVHIFGMTATPFQGIVGNLKYVEDISHRMMEIFGLNLPQCICAGDLAVLSYSVIRSGMGIDKVFDLDKASMALDGDKLRIDCRNPEALERVVRRTQIAKSAFDQRIGQRTKALVFCAPARGVTDGSTEDADPINAFHAKLTAAAFRGELAEAPRSLAFEASANWHSDGRPKDVVFVTGDMPKAHRDALLEKFRTADVPPYVVCTVAMLVEGFDFPDLEHLMLLRPTLSMRLFTQQVGRVTRRRRDRLPKIGKVYEIADDLDTLYDRFGDQIFNEKTIERLGLLSPETRIEELHEGDYRSRTSTGQPPIALDELCVGSTSGRFEQRQLTIPAVGLRARNFKRLVSALAAKTFGALTAEKNTILKAACGFKVRSVEDAQEIARLAGQLEELALAAERDETLSYNCRGAKPAVLREARELLLLSVLTSLKYECADLAEIEKGRIVGALGLAGTAEDIDRLRTECLAKGTRYHWPADLMGAVRDIEWLKGLGKQRGSRTVGGLLPRCVGDVYWAFCYVRDVPEIASRFQSHEWTAQVAKLLHRP